MLLILLIFCIATTASAQFCELPASEQAKIDAIVSGQNTLLGSMAEFKVQQHNDYGTMQTRLNEIEKQQEAINQKIQQVPDQTSLIATLFVFSCLFFSLLFLTIAKGWWPSGRAKQG